MRTVRRPTQKNRPPRLIRQGGFRLTVFVLLLCHASGLHFNLSKKAKHERIDEDTRFYAEIKELRGVWVAGKTKEECRTNLMSALESWIIFRLRRNLPYPISKFQATPFVCGVMPKLSPVSWRALKVGIYSTS